MSFKKSSRYPSLGRWFSTWFPISGDIPHCMLLSVAGCISIVTIWLNRVSEMLQSIYSRDPLNCQPAYSKCAVWSAVKCFPGISKRMPDREGYPQNTALQFIFRPKCLNFAIYCFIFDRLCNVLPNSVSCCFIIMNEGGVKIRAKGKMRIYSYFSWASIFSFRPKD